MTTHQHLRDELTARRADLAAGLVPPDTHRALYPWEVEARTNFAGLENGVDDTAGVIAAQLADDRAQFLELLAADLASVADHPGPLPVDVAIAFRVLALDTVLGLGAVPGAQTLIDQAEQRYRQTLRTAADAGAGRLQIEASQQGVDVGGGRYKLGGEDEYRLDLAARHLAQSPHGDVLDAAADFAYRMPEAGAGQLAHRIVDQVRQLSPNRLDAYARPPVQQADGLGRQAAARALILPERIYASELLDRNTCGPCSLVDGTEYTTLADATDDYPNGTFKDCEGGDQCRGTLVFVWGSEVPGASD